MDWRHILKRGSRAALCVLLIAALSACAQQVQTDDTAGQTLTEVVVTQPQAADAQQAAAGQGDGQAEQPEEALADLLSSFTKGRIQADGQWAAAVQCVGAASCQSAGSGPMQSASLIKLFVAAAVEENRQTLAAGEQYSGETAELLLRMLSESDNDATNELVTRLGAGDPSAGMDLVNQYCAANGYPDTSMGRLMLDFTSTADNYTSVTDCCAFLQAVLENQVPGAEEILSALKQQVRTGKIPAGVPSGVQTANKTGELDTVENDAAIIWAGEKPYILCVMSGGLSDPTEARAQITALSAQVYALLTAE